MKKEVKRFKKSNKKIAIILVCMLSVCSISGVLLADKIEDNKKEEIYITEMESQDIDAQVQLFKEFLRIYEHYTPDDRIDDDGIDDDEFDDSLKMFNLDESPMVELGYLCKRESNIAAVLYFVAPEALYNEDLDEVSKKYEDIEDILIREIVMEFNKLDATVEAGLDYTKEEIEKQFPILSHTILHTEITNSCEAMSDYYSDINYSLNKVGNGEKIVVSPEEHKQKLKRY